MLMFSMHSEDTWVRQALDAGARGYILKNAVDLELVNAVKQRGSGGAGARSGALAKAGSLKGEQRLRADYARTGDAAVDRTWQIEQGDRSRCSGSARTPSPCIAQT